jgi:hypothetical protein
MFGAIVISHAEDCVFDNITVDGEFDVGIDVKGCRNQFNNLHINVRNPVRRTIKIGRNQPCPCGGGKKYKHCHGAV